MIELQESGALHSIVAVTDSGEIAGHGAVELREGRTDTGEQGMFFVSPQYRKSYGIGQALAKGMFELARNLDLINTYTFALTAHAKSQHLFHKLGGNDFAVLLEFQPKDMNIKGFKTANQVKNGIVIQFAWFKKARMRTFTAYPKYKEIICKIYNNAGIPTDMRKMTNNSTIHSEPLFKVRRDSQRRVSFIEITEYGNDIRELSKIITLTTKNLCREKFDMIYLYLPLEKNGCTELISCLEGEEYIFSGLFPDHFPDSDALILQYINNSDNPFEHVQVWSDLAKEIVAFQKEEFKRINNFN